MDSLSVVGIKGTPFLELRGRHPPGSLEDLKLRFMRRVIFLANRWRNGMNEALRATGHSYARWLTLVWVHLLGGRASHRELAERIGVEPPTLIRLLNRLEAEGLVERHTLCAPARAKTVRLTEAGKAVLTKLDAIVEGTRTTYLAGADKARLQTCMALFDELLGETDRS